jgi:hypothetical protein
MRLTFLRLSTNNPLNHENKADREREAGRAAVIQRARVAPAEGAGGQSLMDEGRPWAATTRLLG